MAKSTSRAHAVARMRELLGELRVLTAVFPDLHESFDEDDLPIGFLIRRDAEAVPMRVPRSKRPVKRPRKTSLAKPKRGRVKT
jgi:hypothetical protein